MTAVVETHPLQFPWTFTFFKKAANKGYEENTSVLGTTESVRSARPLVSLGPRLTSFDRANPIRGVCHRSSPPPPPPLQVEDFWRLYVHLRRPVDDRPTVCDYHVFREGIKPMWEDETNVNGGKWIVRLKKGVAARYWEDLVRSHPPLLRRPSPHAREIWQLTQRLLGRSSSRCWGGSSRWETRSAGPCSPCATRRTSSPSGPLQPRRSPEHTPHSAPQALRLSAPRGCTGPQASRSSSALCTPSTVLCTRLRSGACAHARTAHRQEQICRQPASVHADQDDAVQRAAAADGRLARVQEAHRLDARQLLLPQRKLQLRLRAARPSLGSRQYRAAAVGPLLYLLTTT